MSERIRLRERLEEIKQDILPFPELADVMERVNSAIEDILEPEGPHCARSVICEVEGLLDEDKAPDTERSPEYKTHFIRPPAEQ